MKTNKIDLLPERYFKFNNSYCDIFQIGVGGTGSYLVPYISRLLLNNNENKARINEYVLIDGDKVTKENIGRQNFIEEDIGKYKSDVLAKRYSTSLKVNIVSKTVYIVTKEMVEEEIKNRTSIVVSCVDNNQTRKLISEAFKKYLTDYSNSFLIDVGNEKTGGQVFITGNVKKLQPHYEEIIGNTDITEIYPEILNPQDVLPDDSCAERVNQGLQDINVNITAAGIVFNIVNSLISHEKIYFYEIHFTRTNNFKRNFLDFMETL